MRFIDANNFNRLCLEYPAILFPAIQLKKYLREKILGFFKNYFKIILLMSELGQRFWKPLCDYREKFNIDHTTINIKNIPVRVFLIYPQDNQAIIKYIEKRENINPLRVATLRFFFYFILFFILFYFF